MFVVVILVGAFFTAIRLRTQDKLNNKLKHSPQLYDSIFLLRSHPPGMSLAEYLDKLYDEPSLIGFDR